MRCFSPIQSVFCATPCDCRTPGACLTNSSRRCGRTFLKTTVSFQRVHTCTYYIVMCLCCVVFVLVLSLCCVDLLCFVVLYYNYVASLVYVVRLKQMFALWFLERNEHKRFLHFCFQSFLTTSFPKLRVHM